MMVSAAAQPGTMRVPLPGHVLEGLPDTAHFVAKSAMADDSPITLTVVLRRNDELGFQLLLEALYDTNSPEYRRWRTPQQLADQFGPFRDDYEAVEAFFRDQGFSILERTSNRMTLTISAPRRTVEHALGVSIRDYDISESSKAQVRRFYANDADPQLPADIAWRVHSISGLSSLAQARRASPTAAPLRDKIGQAGCKAVDAILKLAGGDPPMTAKDIIPACGPQTTTNGSNGGSGGGSSSDARDTAHDPGPLAWIGVTGAGQKIGLVQFDTYLASDVADYAAYLRLPAFAVNRVTRVPVNGGATLGPDQSEVLLDIAYILPVATGATITVYDSPFTGAGSFQALFNRAIADGMTIISNSWAYCENETSAADVQSLDAIFAAAAASGISIFNAAGDSGSTCLNGAPNTIAVPAGAPHATAVGGTTQNLGPGATLASEVWWDGFAHVPQTGRSGFGLSRFFPRPAYQSGLNAQPYRSIPDVVTNADPATGIQICWAAGGGCPDGKLYGGTSMAAPAMAAYVALLNHARAANLGFVNPAFYALAGTEAFRSPASLGVDFARAGIGSPNINALHVQLNGIARGPADAIQTTVEGYVNYFDALTIVTLGGVPADGTSMLSIVVTVRDANGHTLPGRTVTLSATPPGVTIAPASAQSSVNNGAAIFATSSLTAQNVQFTATIQPEGIQVPMGAPIPFVFPLVASAGIAAFPTTVANDGVATTTITVTLQDALGRPAPGKEVLLSQGGGHSVITAPTPTVTDAAGQIQFTATNRHAEAVTYTAVIVTDGDVPVPGSATVTFSGSAPTSCVGAITPAPAFAATPIATGFVAEAFFFSNVNWGCAGASNPAFYANGDFLIANFRTGALYRMPPQGGAASSGQIISNPGLTLGLPVWGNDGRLYVAPSATGSGFFSGAIYELDPQTGATLRTLASGLACLSPLAVDPISGDLFYTGTCFGAGSNDANLYRVHNTSGASPTVVVYATLPGSPNGSVSFAPDGTMFIGTQYTSPNPPVVRVSGTNQPQPPTITPVAGVLSNFWVTVGEALPNGAAKSLIVNTPDGKLKLADITTNPVTFTEILTTGASSGVIGQDGCLYTSNGETVYRITAANGSCVFAPTSPAPAVALTPAIASPNPPQGTTHNLTAKLVGVPPAAGVEVRFRVRGVNDQDRIVRTNASGIATLALQGVFTGTDRVTAEATVGAAVLDSNTASVTWTAGKHTSFVSLNGGLAGGIVGTSVQLSASLFDQSAQPNVAISGATLQFSVAGQTCNAITNASGVASCNVTIPLTGTYTLLVTFAGNASFTATTDARQFGVVSAPPPPCFAFNDVDSISSFCANVEWIKNRSVTLGCAASLYCPIDPVSRLQMAAFMNRLGTALTPVLLSATAAPGALDFDAEPVVCQTEDFDADFFDRRAIVDGSLSVRANADLGFAADAVASFDGGATWVPLAGVGNRGFAAAMQWGHLRASGVADLTTNQTVRFGIAVSRGGLPGNSDASDSQCRLRVAIASR